MGLIIATSFLVGCGVNNITKAESDIDFTRIGRDYCFDVYKDKETGVHYIKYDDNYGVGLCPRYRADGQLYVD